MKTLITFVFGCALLLTQRGATTAQEGTGGCNIIGFVMEDGVCVFRPHDIDANRDKRSLRHAEGTRHKRQTVERTCPYCALGVWMVYPDWADCTAFFLCLNGVNLRLQCADLSPDVNGTKFNYFHPTRLTCLQTLDTTNTCVFRN